MYISEKERDRLEQLCNQFRIELIKQLHAIQTGHPGGSLSSCEILTLLYQRHLQIDPKEPKAHKRDRCILGKGHAAPMLYLNLAERGFFPKADFSQLRQLGSHLQGHPCMNHTPGVDISTGPLGLGISAALGMALSLKQDELDNYVYVVLGDGEIQEGIVWEAAMAAHKFQADNLIAILDNNGVQLDGPVAEVMPLGDISAKWESFGWHVIEADGHNLVDLDRAIVEAKKVQGKPILINAKTVKGKGISFMEGDHSWHGKPISIDDYTQALKELGGE